MIKWKKEWRDGEWERKKKKKIAITPQEVHVKQNKVLNMSYDQMSSHSPSFHLPVASSLLRSEKNWFK